MEINLPIRRLDDAYYSLIRTMINNMLEHEHVDDQGRFTLYAAHPPIVVQNVKKAVEYIETARGADLQKEIRFLEIGCGIGINLYMIKHLQTNIYDPFRFRFCDLITHGLELRPNYVEIAKKIIHPSMIICGDALTFESYHSYDILYFWRPISDYQAEVKFENKVMKDMRVGSILVSYHAPMSTHYLHHFKHLGECCWLKVEEIP